MIGAGVDGGARADVKLLDCAKPESLGGAAGSIADRSAIAAL